MSAFEGLRVISITNHAAGEDLIRLLESGEAPGESEAMETEAT